jgi:CHAD domain-containing protein
MAESYLEREVKLDVDEDFVLPDVARDLGVPARIEVVDQQLESRYFDTETHALLNAHMSLRRRSGTADAGWQLKVPHPPAREEIRVAELSDDVPTELRVLLLGVSQAEPLRPLATLTTRRTVYRVLDERGEALADIADDHVQATAGNGVATISSWREVEVELGKGDEGLATAIVKRLRKAGAHEAASASKLARAVEGGAAAPASMQRAADAVLCYVMDQQRAILAGDVALRRENAGAVHQTRVAVRRLRSVLRAYAPLFEPGSTQALDEELRWFAGLLGQVRDRQVLRRRILGLIDELPPELVVGAVRSRVVTELDREQSQHWAQLRQELVGARYLELLRQLTRWTAAPSWSNKADESLAYVEKLARRAERQARQRLHAARSAESEQVADALHRARKAAKRARYAYEVLQLASPSKKASKQAKRFRALQDLLGQHQDSRASAAVLCRLGAASETPGSENGFTFGVLYQREQELARSVRDAAASY